MFEADGLRLALATLGTLLSDRGLAYELVAIGGGSLLLLDVIRRPTRDLDALALVEDGDYTHARPLPSPLQEAIEDTARVLGLAPDWLNSGPADQLAQGLPPGFRERTTALVFGGLTVHVAGRFDLICLKLYAAVDDGPGSKHVRDLLDLDPSSDELTDAAAWVRQQDAGEAFPAFVATVVAHIEELRAQR